MQHVHLHNLKESTLSKKSFVPAFTPRSLAYTVTKKSSHVWYLTVHVPSTMAVHIKDHVTQMYRAYSIMPGMSCQHLPPSYTEHYFAQEIERDTRHFLYNYFVEESVQVYLKDHGTTIVNWPRPCDVNGAANSGYTYTIALSLAPEFTLANWNTLTFNPPKRKNYTDLDCQVEAFIATLLPVATREEPRVSTGDWVRLRAQFRSPHLTGPLSESSYHWLHMSTPYVTTPLMHHLLGKKKGEVLTLPASVFAPIQTEDAPTDYLFTITIDALIKTTDFSVESVQETLESPSREALHNKLIEIFSYRNDISLRKAIIEELFYLLFSSYRFDIPPHAITRRKELLLQLMHYSPDSTVYTKQRQFPAHIALLAETKLKEESLIDALAQFEKVEVTPEDIAAYLSLCSHERLREFVYFFPLDESLVDSDQPCAEHHIAQTVRREKTLNLVLKTLCP